MKDIPYSGSDEKIRFYKLILEKGYECFIQDLINKQKLHDSKKYDIIQWIKFS